MSDRPNLHSVFKASIIRSAIEMESARVNMVAEANKELTEKLRARGAYPFWYSWHSRKNGDIKFEAFGVLDEGEAVRLQWDNRAARIRIGLKP